MALTTAFILGATVFVATNLDDLFILLAFFADPAYRAREIVFGQYLGNGALVFVSIVAALIALAVPAQYVGLLGLAPIAIGIKELIESWRDKDDDGEAIDRRPRSSGWGRTLAVAAVTIAAGGDNIAVYTPLFAIRSGAEIAMIVFVFVLLTAWWCAFAHWLVQHRAFGAPIRRYGHRVLPFVLMALGAWILYDAGTFRAM